MDNRRWLEENIELNADKIRFILQLYFKEKELLSDLTEEELESISCVFITKLLNTPDCVSQNSYILLYREIFDILIPIYDSIRPNEDNLTIECYKMTQFFHSKRKLIQK